MWTIFTLTKKLFLFWDSYWLILGFILYCLPDLNLLFNLAQCSWSLSTNDLCWLVCWSVCINIHFDSTSWQKLILINDSVKAFFSANHIHVFYSYYISQSHSFIFIGLFLFLFLFLFLLLFSVVLSINLKLTRASSYLVAWVTEKKYESEEIWVWRNMSL